MVLSLPALVQLWINLNTSNVALLAPHAIISAILLRQQLIALAAISFARGQIQEERSIRRGYLHMQINKTSEKSSMRKGMCVVFGVGWEGGSFLDIII